MDITPKQSSEGFIPFKLVGGRFDEAGADLDAFTELQTYREILRSVARDIYKKENPDDSRVPNGFEKTINFKFGHYIDGSVVPTIVPVDGEQSLKGILNKSIDEVRHLFVALIHQHEWNSSAPLSDATKKAIQKLGSTLGPDEAIEYSEGALYTADIRQSVIDSWKSNEKILETPLLGFITEIDAERSKFSMRLPSGRTIDGAYSDYKLFSELHQYVRPFEEGEVLRLKCDYIKGIGGAEKIVDVQDVEKFISRNHSWSTRLIDLISLQQGWIENCGLPVPMDIAELANCVLEKLAAQSEVLPEIFPMPEGGIQLEFTDQSKHLEVSLLSHEEFHEGFFYDSNTKEASEENLRTPEEIVDFLMRWGNE